MTSLLEKSDEKERKIGEKMKKNAEGDVEEYIKWLADHEKCNVQGRLNKWCKNVNAIDHAIVDEVEFMKFLFQVAPGVKVFYGGLKVVPIDEGSVVRVNLKFVGKCTEYFFHPAMLIVIDLSGNITQPLKSSN